MIINVFKFIIFFYKKLRKNEECKQRGIVGFRNLIFEREILHARMYVKRQMNFMESNNKFVEKENFNNKVQKFQ